MFSERKMRRQRRRPVESDAGREFCASPQTQIQGGHERLCNLGATNVALGSKQADELMTKRNKTNKSHTSESQLTDYHKAFKSHTTTSTTSTSTCGASERRHQRKLMRTQMSRSRRAERAAKWERLTLALLSSCTGLLLLLALLFAGQLAAGQEGARSPAAAASANTNKQHQTTIQLMRSADIELSRRSLQRQQRDATSAAAAAVPGGPSTAAVAENGLALQAGATCGYPGSPAHASVTFNTSQVLAGTAASYTCDNGYELLGPPRRICQPNGSWSPVGIPFCVLNVGLGKAAMQSSTAGHGSAQKAVDGSTSPYFQPNTCTMTDVEHNPWWYVNLLEPYLVQIVRIDFGQPCCANRQKATIAVRVGNNRPDLGNNPLCNRYHGFIEEGKPLFLPCTRPAPGAFVSIHLEAPSGSALSICETFIYTDHALSIEQCPSFRDQPLGSTATYNGKCYLFHNNQALPFEGARKYCESRGGSLVDETSPALQGFLSWELYRRHRNDQLMGQYWLGATRDARNSQNWKWINGRDVQISFWNSLANQGNCSRFDGSKGWLWSDTDCGAQLNFICQYRPLSCGKPEKPTNSTLITRNIDNGTVIEYQCAPGNLLMGPKSRVCLPTGFFSEFAPKCKYLDCQFPAQIANGDYKLLNGTTAYQSMVTYFCQDGFQLYGRPTLTCDVDERWNGPPPRCEPLLCPAPVAPSNGYVTVTANITTPGTQATYDCRPNYELVGDKLLTCLASGSWDNSFPYCREKRQAPQPVKPQAPAATAASPSQAAQPAKPARPAGAANQAPALFSSNRVAQQPQSSTTTPPPPGSTTPSSPAASLNGLAGQMTPTAQVGQGNGQPASNNEIVAPPPPPQQTGSSSPSPMLVEQQQQNRRPAQPSSLSNSFIQAPPQLPAQTDQQADHSRTPSAVRPQLQGASATAPSTMMNSRGPQAASNLAPLQRQPPPPPPLINQPAASTPGGSGGHNNRQFTFSPIGSSQAPPQQQQPTTSYDSSPMATTNSVSVHSAGHSNQQQPPVGTSVSPTTFSSTPAAAVASSSSVGGLPTSQMPPGQPITTTTTQGVNVLASFGGANGGASSLRNHQAFHPHHQGHHNSLANAKYSLDGIIAVAIFGGFIFLGAIITILVIIIRRRKSGRSSSIDAQTISTYDSNGAEQNGLYRNYQQAWENLRFAAPGSQPKSSGNGPPPPSTGGGGGVAGLLSGSAAGHLHGQSIGLKSYVAPQVLHHAHPVATSGGHHNLGMSSSSTTSSSSQSSSSLAVTGPAGSGGADPLLGPHHHSSHHLHSRASANLNVASNLVHLQQQQQAAAEMLHARHHAYHAHNLHSDDDDEVDDDDDEQGVISADEATYQHHHNHRRVAATAAPSARHHLQHHHHHHHHLNSEGFRDSNELTINADTATLASNAQAVSSAAVGGAQAAARRRLYSTNSMSRSMAAAAATANRRSTGDLNHHNHRVVSSSSSGGDSTRSSRASPPNNQRASNHDDDDDDHSLDRLAYGSNWHSATNAVNQQP